MIHDYFEWLCSRIGLYSPETNYYSKLVDLLFNIDFRYDVPMDENRMLDGLDLRCQWADDVGAIGDIFGDKPCSVLEALAALSFRVEDDIIGDTTQMIFWQFLWNIGLRWATDRALTDKGDIEEVRNVVDEWMDGDRSITEYYNDGREIWYQVMGWLSDRYG